MGIGSYGLKINKDVISQISETAAIEVAGVVGLGNAPISKTITIKNPVKNSGTVIKTDNGAIIIDIYIDILQSAKVKTVAEEVQKNVKDKVQTMTGSPVAAVNVFICKSVQDDEESAD